MEPSTTSIPNADAPLPVLGLATLFRNSGILYGSTMVTMGLSVATKAVQARLLTTEGLGLLLTAQTLAALAATAAQLSVPEALVKFIGREGRGNMPYAAALVRKALWTSSACSIALLAAAWFARNFISAMYHDQKAGPLLVLLVAAVPLNAAAIVLCSAYRGFGQIWEKVAFVDTVPAIAVLAGLFGAKLAGQTSPEAVGVIYLAASAVSFALAAWYYGRDKDFKVPGEPVETGELLRFSVPLFASQLVGWPVAMIPLMLGAKTLSGVAYYNIALALGSLSYTVVGAAETAALPVWSNRIGQGLITRLRKDYAATTEWCLLASSIVFALLFFRTADVIRILYGAKNVGGAAVVRCVAPYFLLSAATGPNESLLKAFGATRWIFASRLAGGAAVVAAVIAFRSSSGLATALAGYWLSSMTGLLMYAIYLAVVYKVHPFSRGYARSVASVGLSLAIIAVTARWVELPWAILNLIATAGIYVSVLLLMLFMSGYFSNDNTPVRGLISRLRAMRPAVSVSAASTHRKSI